MSITPRVVLVSMPWTFPFSPSIQIGSLQAALLKQEIQATTRSYHLGFLGHCLRQITTPVELQSRLRDYLLVLGRSYETGVGDWVFAHPPFSSAGRGDLGFQDQLIESLRVERAKGNSPNMSFIGYFEHEPHEEIRQKLAWIKVRAGEFLEVAVNDILQADPHLVGFTNTFSQTIASATLSKMLKARAPDIKIVFGGSSCEGDMGVAMMRAYPWIDFVVRGEGEHVIADLARVAAGEAALRRSPGLCYRHEGVVQSEPEGASSLLPIDELPLPNYDEYFALRSSLAATLPSWISEQISAMQPELPLRSARGCWWGAKNQCTFCGIGDATYSSRSSERVVKDVQTLSERYKARRFQFTDWIIDHRYLSTVLPEFQQLGYDLQLFWEIKVLTNSAEIKRLADAGVTSLQPGIESLSTSLLKLMQKGTTGLHNIRFLKWVTEFGIEVGWNILYRFPGEDPAWYDDMIRVLPSLWHLPPPSGLTPFLLDRFSVYHRNIERFPAIQNVRPMPFMTELYEASEADLMDMSYRFMHDVVDQDLQYTEALVRESKKWREAHRAGARLTCKVGAGFVEIEDRRSPRERPRVTLLEGLEGEVYELCDAGPKLSSILRATRERASVSEIQALLDRLCDARLMYTEDERYLSLALHTRARATHLSNRKTSDLVRM
ncbi:RiPP maturation radical SAM C-methyltransferase [Polyangium sp. rjm3]|uniref:RiPP maturation radical SAM C-methyltransferase n=2 Tax=Polyangium mundeleinium TaxID=2995306 RepID=A0ABT5EMD4_9BACT|nr:RiPP maturation radical SAM C-methyltransferase [Polyangium mundeleinium]